MMSLSDTSLVEKEGADVDGADRDGAEQEGGTHVKCMIILLLCKCYAMHEILNSFKQKPIPKF